MLHALLYDPTHDNESPMNKRSAEDAISTGALVTFSYSAIGSVKGFDDLYPKLLNLVGEKRKYKLNGLDDKGGIARAKRILNSLHLEMVLGGYEEGHVHQENDVSHAFPTKYHLLCNKAFHSISFCRVFTQLRKKVTFLSLTPPSKRTPRTDALVSKSSRQSGLSS